MAIKWKGELENRRVELLSLGYNYIQVADLLSMEFGIPISRKSIDNRCQNIKRSKNTNNYEISDECTIFQDDCEIITTNEENNLFPNECYDIDKELCMTPEKIKELSSMYDVLTNLHPRKILSLSDLHAPFIDFKSIEKAILEHEDADICLLNGDVLDLQSMSKFDKMIEIDLDEELKQVFMLLDVLTKRYKYVVWVGGNHDLRRFMSYVMHNFSGNMKKFVLKRLNPMDYVAERYDNLMIVPHDWVQIGDVIFAHLQNYSNVDMKTVVLNNEIFNALRYLLPNPNYKAIIIGHTHQCGKIILNDTLLIEQGCLCYTQDYKFMKPTKKKWQTGYAVINFNEKSEVKFNDTNFYTI